MIIFYKTKENGAFSKWVSLNTKHQRKILRQMKKTPPESIVVRVGEFFENSPDRCEEIEIAFEVFFALAYEFELAKERMDKEDARHRDDRMHFVLEITGHPGMILGNVIEDHELWMVKNKVREAISLLPQPQSRRAKMYYLHQMTQQEIADVEGVSQKAIGYSLRAARKNLKKILK